MRQPPENKDRSRDEEGKQDQAPRTPAATWTPGLPARDGRMVSLSGETLGRWDNEERNGF